MCLNRHRRSIAVLPNNSMRDGGVDESAAHSGRKTIGGLSSAVSYASNLNKTFSVCQQQGSEGGKFQLDPKFFQNDFDGDESSTLVLGKNDDKETSAVSNRSASCVAVQQTPVGAKVLMPGRGGLANGNGAKVAADHSSMDLQPIVII